MRHLNIIGIICIFLFIVLFSVRLGLFEKHASDSSDARQMAASERDTWMNILQNDRKIGFSHTTVKKLENNYQFQETVFMRINMLGMVQEINLNTDGILNPDLTLSSIQFELRAGAFRFKAEGRITKNVMHMTTHSIGAEQTFDIPLEKPLYLTGGIPDVVSAAGVRTGDSLLFEIFDPTTMSHETVEVKVIAKENVRVMGFEQASTKISLNFKGAIQYAWISESGEILKEEGLLGITLEKTTYIEAVAGLSPDSSMSDIAEVASVRSNVSIENPSQLKFLKVRLSNIDMDSLHLASGRQHLDSDILTIRKESLDNLRPDMVTDTKDMVVFLAPSPFIQSDHEKIRNLVTEIVSDEDTPLEKANKLMAWINKNIEKRPVISLPDAVSTLENRMGDCNEHAVLFAAIARAASIPAKIEAGLVYMNGRFYYHAWNLLYLGEWITADAVFGQLPADVSHIRFSTGTQQDQTDLMGIIGKVRLEIMEML